jgi:hypothetical protein
MKTLPAVRAACVAVVCAGIASAGCATKTTASGGRETNVLGGAITVASDSFQPTTPATVDADTSKIVGRGNPSGKKISLFWGLITLHDY